MTNSDQTSAETGERYAKSPLTGNYYRVTEWVDHGDGKIQAKDKELVDREDVPDDWLEVLDDE